MPKSKPIIDGTKKKFENKFKVTTSGKENKFFLDDTNTAYYNPDLVFRSKRNNSRIKAIIEVEQCARKHIVGGVITADYCMGREKQSPSMFVLALNEKDKKDYQKREKLLKTYTKHLKKIIIGNKAEVWKALSNLKNL